MPPFFFLSPNFFLKSVCCLTMLRAETYVNACLRNYRTVVLICITFNAIRLVFGKKVIVVGEFKNHFARFKALRRFDRNCFFFLYSVESSADIFSFPIYQIAIMQGVAFREGVIAGVRHCSPPASSLSLCGPIIVKSSV